MSNVIDLSASWVTPMLPRLFRLYDGAVLTSVATAGLLNSGNNQNYGFGSGEIRLMKGVPPTSFAELASFSTRKSDTLCIFVPGLNSAGNFAASQLTINPCIITTEYITAIASGTATWFWWYVKNDTYAESENWFKQNAYGTIGVIGSSSDLEMPDVNVIAGQQYRISGLQLRIPTTWTF